jgi:hypothetical protein
MNSTGKDMATTEEVTLDRIAGLLERIADAVERVASSMEPAEDENEPGTVADHLGVLANCVSTEDGNGLCEAIFKAARIVRDGKQPGGHT